MIAKSHKTYRSEITLDSEISAVLSTILSHVTEFSILVQKKLAALAV